MIRCRKCNEPYPLTDEVKLLDSIIKESREDYKNANTPLARIKIREHLIKAIESKLKILSLDQSRTESRDISTIISELYESDEERVNNESGAVSGDLHEDEGETDSTIPVPEEVPSGQEKIQDSEQE